MTDWSKRRSTSHRPIAICSSTATARLRCPNLSCSFRSAVRGPAFRISGGQLQRARHCGGAHRHRERRGDGVRASRRWEVRSSPGRDIKRVLRHARCGDRDGRCRFRYSPSRTSPLHSARWSRWKQIVTSSELDPLLSADPISCRIRGFDSSGYKRPTLTRRVQGRLDECTRPASASTSTT